MNASFSYVVRNLARRRTRTVVGILGILLTICFLTAIQAGIDSLSVSYIDLVSLQAGKADLLIRAPGGDPLNPTAFAPEEVEKKLERNPELLGLSPRLLGVVQLYYRGKQQYAVLIGVDPAKEHKLDLWGIKPEPALTGKSAAFSHSLVEKLKLTTNGIVTLTSPSVFNEVEVTFGGTVEKQLFLPQQVRDFVVVPLDVSREVLGQPGKAHLLAGAFHNPRSNYDARDLHQSVLRLKRVGQSFASSLGMDYEVRLPKAEAITAFQNFTSPLRAFFGVFAILTLTITGLLIYSLISVSVEERVREYAILRALGGRRRDIFRLVLGESLMLCSLGVLPGVFIGLLFAKMLIAVIGLAAKVPTPLALEVTAQSLWLSLGGGFAVAIGSALLPAYNATRRSIVDALDPLRRGQIPPNRTSEFNNHPLIILGLALSVLSGVVFFVLPSAVLSGNPSLIGTVLLCLLLSLLVGFTLLMVGCLPFVERLLLRLIGWLFGPAAELAGRNLERHRRRHTTTALLFTLSVSLVIFIASLVALSSGTALSIVEHTHGADLKIYSPSIGESVKTELAQVPNVSSVSEVQFLRPRTAYGTAYDVTIADLVGMKNLWVVPFGVDTELSHCVYTNGIVWANGSPAALTQVTRAFSNETNAADWVPPVILSESIAKFLEVTPGDQVQMSFHLAGERTQGRFTVVGVASAFPGLDNFRARVANAVGSGVLMNIQDFQRLTRSAPGDAMQCILFAKVNGAAKAQKSAAQFIRDRFDVRYQFGVQSTAETKEQARILYWATQVFFAMLLGVAVIIAVFALIASMATTVLERQREVGVLKALGLRRGQLFRLFLAEAIVLTLAAGIAGGIIGFALAWLFVFQAAVLMEIAAVFTMPYLTFAATLLISIVAGALAAHIPTRTLLRRSAAEILRA